MVDLLRYAVGRNMFLLQVVGVVDAMHEAAAAGHPDNPATHVRQTVNMHVFNWSTSGVGCWTLVLVIWCWSICVQGRLRIPYRSGPMLSLNIL